MSRLIHLLTKRFPRNFIFRHPLWGSFILMLFCFLFVILYRPLDTHASKYFNYPVTMAVYCSLASAFVFVLILTMRKIPVFSDRREWNILREILAILTALAGMGIAIYFLAFVLEVKSERWNFSTLWNSVSSAFLVGLIPFAFFTLSNYRHLFTEEISKDFATDPGNMAGTATPEEKIHIVSQLKKEELSFFPRDLIYVESDGNYVIFCLAGDRVSEKKLIRNSISNIGKQLESVPWFVRTHRAFIVNIKRVRQKQGNALGYRLKLTDTDAEIPVSRQKVTTFDEVISRFR